MTTISAKKFFRQAAKGSKSQYASKALQRLVENSPGFGSLALFAGHVDCETGPALSWTDGVNIYYPKSFTKISLAEQIGVLAHEVMHIAFRHVQRFEQMRKHYGNINYFIANIAADAIINQSLVGYSWLQLPGKPVMLVDLLREVLGEDWKPEDALAHWSLESLYKTLIDRTPRQISRGQNSNTLGESNADRVDRYAKSRGFEQDMVESPTPLDPAAEAEESRNWRNRILRAKAGDGVRGILRKPLADIPDTSTPWEHILRSKVTAALMPKSRETWVRPSQRWLSLHHYSTSTNARTQFPFEPGVDLYTPTLKLAVCLDTSGSINEDLFNRFIAELIGIQKRTNAMMVVIVADMTIHDEKTITWADQKDQFLKKIQFKGQGGTDFTPALKRCDELNVAQIVYLTDLEGPANYQPKAPVVWAVPKRFGQHPKPPFGTLLLID